LAQQKLIVGISGATGAIYGIRLLEVLNKMPQVETHLVLSEPAKRIIIDETGWTIPQVESLASYVYNNEDLGEAISSGSFEVDGMVICPCSIKTMSAVATSFNYHLLVRAADVTLKERRPLVLVVRETPLHSGHLKSMMELSERGATILPPVPAFYNLPQSIDEIINQTVGKVLDQFKIEHQLFRRWSGQKPTIIK
jgi:4-hydroxy-3-polyprenylbenzoate decarboxylase